MEGRIYQIIRDLKTQGKTPKETAEFLVESESLIFPRALNLVLYSPEWKHLMGDSNPFVDEIIRIADEDEERKVDED